MNVDDMKKKISKKTKVILPVHISGRGINIEQIITIAKKKKIYVVEDAAEAFMSSINNKFLGTYGNVGCFSFAPNKIITTGQGGAIITNNKSIYNKILQLKDQGRIGIKTGGEDNYVSEGYNFKFTNIQASLGLSQINSINQRVKILKNHYLFYKKNIIKNKNFKVFDFDVKKGQVPLWTDAFCTKRAKLFNFLSANQVFLRFFWQSINTCKPYKKSFKGLKNSKNLQKKLFWLPSSLALKKKDLLKVCNLINKFIVKNFKKNE
jgi:perosamine synthetase